MIAIATGTIKRPRYSRVRSVACDIVFKSRPMRTAVGCEAPSTRRAVRSNSSSLLRLRGAPERGPHPGLPGCAHRCINQNVAIDAPRLTICAQVHTPQYTNYGYNNAAGDDEAKMVAEGTKHAAEIGVITKADDIVCAVHAYKAGATKNVAMRFYYAGAAL